MIEMVNNQLTNKYLLCAYYSSELEFEWRFREGIESEQENKEMLVWRNGKYGGIWKTKVEGLRN